MAAKETKKLEEPRTSSPSREGDLSGSKAGKGAPLAGQLDPTKAGSKATPGQFSASKTKGASREKRPNVTAKTEDQVIAQGLVADRNGVVYLRGCAAPVWRLEMARRAGSSRAAMIAAFPSLTSPGLDLAFDYAQKNRTLMDTLIRQQGPVAVSGEDEEPDDPVAFEADLESLLSENAEVFRRLAQ